MGESLGNIFGTKLPPDNCFPWTPAPAALMFLSSERNVRELELSLTVLLLGQVPKHQLHDFGLKVACDLNIE